MTAPEPTACPTCEGSRVVGNVTQSWCAACTCVHCGQPTLTPPECEGGCDVLEEAQAKRRDDR